MKNINKLSLSDLINGLSYLEDYAERIENYIISIEKSNQTEIKLMQNKGNSIRRKVINFRKEIKRRLLDDNEIKVMKRIDERDDTKIIKDYIDTAKKLGDIPKGGKYKTKKLFRKLNDKKFLTNLMLAIEKERNKLEFEDEEVLKELWEYHFAKLNRITSKNKKSIKTVSINKQQIENIPDNLEGEE